MGTSENSPEDLPQTLARSVVAGDSEKSTSEFYVVGIGASAGDLDPIERFFDNMPPNTGMAFVIVQHLSPDFKSLMDELLARHTNDAHGSLLGRGGTLGGKSKLARLHGARPCIS